MADTFVVVCANIVALNLYYLVSSKSLHFLFRIISFAAPPHVVILERKRRISWDGVKF